MSAALLAPLMIQFGSQLMQGLGGYQQANADADAAEINAQIARDNARMELERGEWQAAATRKSASREMGDQRARMVGSGQLMTGSNAAIMAQSAESVEQDVGMTRREAALRALNFNRQAKALEKQASQTRKSAAITGLTSIMGAATNAYMGYKSIPGGA